MFVIATCYLHMKVSSSKNSSLLTTGPEQTDADQHEAVPAGTCTAALLAAGQAALREWHEFEINWKHTGIIVLLAVWVVCRVRLEMEVRDTTTLRSPRT